MDLNKVNFTRDFVGQIFLQSISRQTCAEELRLTLLEQIFRRKMSDTFAWDYITDTLQTGKRSYTN